MSNLHGTTRSLGLIVAWCVLVAALGVAGMLHRRGGAFGLDPIAWVLLALAVALYPLPALLAVTRGHRDAVRIALLDLLLGWTGVAWLVALVWSLASPESPALERERADRGA